MRNKSPNLEFFSSFAQPQNTAVNTFSSFHRPQGQISQPFHIPEAWKRYPFRAEPPHIGHYREYLSPRIVSSPFLKLFVAFFLQKSAFRALRWVFFSLSSWMLDPLWTFFHTMISSQSWLVFTKSKLIPRGKQDHGGILFSKCMKFMVECEQITKTDWFLCRFLFSMERNRQLFKR